MERIGRTGYDLIRSHTVQAAHKKISVDDRFCGIRD